MTAQQPIRLVGHTSSPYTQKMVALQRYRRGSDAFRVLMTIVQDTVNGFYEAVQGLTSRYTD
ncbi:MAG: hypothetical protein V7754_08915 [Halioglobus sp.]